ncbi:MAG: HD domain-containing protein [Victivallaceae bacterium]|nr:HD domain-containing protein [Victivallaceae bacterium]
MAGFNSGGLEAALLARVRRHFADADGCHDLDHTLRVLRNAAALIAALPEADAAAVRMAALLHDIGRAVGGGRNHAVTGAELAAVWLDEAGAPPELAAKVVSAIARHRFRGNGETPVTVEDKILYDADKLDSLGAAGIGRAFLFAGRCGARLHNTEEEALAGAPYGREDTAYREYLVKLRHLPGRMFTGEGRRLAADRMRVMEAFFAELTRETGDDL